LRSRLSSVGADAPWRWATPHATLDATDQEDVVKGPVICGIDESRTAEGAVAAARDLADRYELPLVFAHVWDGHTRTDAVRRMLRKAAETHHADIVIENGHPADRLVELAYARRASFLVVGNHGARASLLGSISADVSRRAPCPVLVVSPLVPVQPERGAGDTSELNGGILRFDLAHGAQRVP
jgi:nucleotide-binding universal stress UspA family protein